LRIECLPDWAHGLEAMGLEAMDIQAMGLQLMALIPKQGNSALGSEK
jgi:hypothetical protein